MRIILVVAMLCLSLISTTANAGFIVSPTEPGSVNFDMSEALPDEQIGAIELVWFMADNDRSYGFSGWTSTIYGDLNESGPVWSSHGGLIGMWGIVDVPFTGDGVFSVRLDSPSQTYEFDSVCGRFISESTGWYVSDCISGTPRVHVSEPGTLALFGVGLAAMGLARRKKKVWQNKT